VLVNPAEGLTSPRTVKSPPRHVLTVRQVHRLLLAPDVTDTLGLRDRAMLEVFYATGVRVSELIGLNTADVDLESDELHVRRGKGGKSRSVPMGKDASLWIGKYLERSRPDLLLKASEKALFISCRGRRFDRANLARIVRTYGKQARISWRVTPHIMRHSFATHLIKGHASLRHVQEMLGHASLNSTQVYTHLDITDLKATHQRCHPRGRRRKRR